MARYPWVLKGYSPGKMITCAECGEAFIESGGHECGEEAKPENSRHAFGAWMTSGRGAREWLRNDIDYEAEQTGWKYYD